MKLTNWIPGDVKPVRVGVYQRKYDQNSIASSTWYCYWNGEFWGVHGGTPKKAELNRGLDSPTQNLPWRGLAEEPK